MERVGRHNIHTTTLLSHLPSSSSSPTQPDFEIVVGDELAAAAEDENDHNGPRGMGQDEGFVGVGGLVQLHHHHLHHRDYLELDHVYADANDDNGDVHHEGGGAYHDHGEEEAESSIGIGTDASTEALEQAPPLSSGAVDLARSGPIPINVRDQFADGEGQADPGALLCRASFEAEVTLRVVDPDEAAPPPGEPREELQQHEQETFNVDRMIIRVAASRNDDDNDVDDVEADLDASGHTSDDAVIEGGPGDDVGRGGGSDHDDDEAQPGGRRESTRSIMTRLAVKLGKQPDDVLPFTLQLEREWLLTREQLRTTLASDDDAVLHRLQFPLGLVFSLKEELGITEGDVPNMLKYKVLKKQIEMRQRAAAAASGGGEHATAMGKDGSPSAMGRTGNVAGRKRKRLTVADWREKVERFAHDTQHAPSPFRATSIFQVECFCCGYAVNMNKPGQLYYLRRHVEGVRPDIRMSNHTKNYRRWQRQYQGGVNMDELPPLPREPKKQRTRGTAEEDFEEELERGEFSAGEDEHSEHEHEHELDHEHEYELTSSSSISTYSGQDSSLPANDDSTTEQRDLPDLTHLVQQDVGDMHDQELDQLHDHHHDHDHNHHTQVHLPYRPPIDDPHSFHNSIISAPLSSLTHISHLPATTTMSHSLLSPHMLAFSPPPQPMLMPVLHNHLQPQPLHAGYHQHHSHHNQHHSHHQPHPHLQQQLQHGDYVLPPILSTHQHHQQQHHHHAHQHSFHPSLDKDDHQPQL